MNQEQSILLDANITRTKHTRHGLMMYFKNDQYVGHALDVYGEFSEAETSLFNEIVSEGDVVVEIGANIGAHTVQLGKKVGSTGCVLAFEPQRRVFQVLCANLALNEIANVHAYNMGLGDRQGWVDIAELDFTQINNIGGLALGKIENAPSTKVEVRTLDSFNLSRVDFLKIDVEGMEKMVLDGAKETIQRCRPIMYIENDREEKSAELISTLFGLGYKAWWHLPLFFNIDNFFKNTVNIFPEGLVSVNMICIPQEIEANITTMDPVISSSDTWHGKRILGCY